MKMFHRPRTLWTLAVTAWLTIPLLMLNVSVFEKASLLRSLTMPSMRVVVVLAVWVFATSYWIFRARKIGFWSFGVLSGVVLYGNIYFLMTTKNYGLAFFALGMMILSVFFAINLFQTLSLVYFDSGRAWYEQYPRFIPHLMGSLKVNDQEVVARIAKLAGEGCFVFTNGVKGVPSKLTLSVDTHTIQPLECDVELVSKTNDETGLGLQFKLKTQDQRKDLNDFIDRLRSFGYV